MLRSESYNWSFHNRSYTILLHHTRADSNHSTRYKYLSQDQRLVYEQIDNSGNDGIWTRTIKHRLRIHESVFNACIKQLESKGYIRDIKSVEKTKIKDSFNDED